MKRGGTFNEWGLTDKREKFAHAIVAGMGNKDAYKHAFNAANMKDTTIAVKACELLAIPAVTARVAMLRVEAAEKAGLKAADVMEETRRIALSTPAGVIDRDTGKIKLPHELDAATAAAVQSFEIDDLGRIKYKFWDKNSALERAAKLLGMFREDNEQSRPTVEVKRIELVALQPLPKKGT